MAVALYPGSFDPVHNGHLAIIATASPLFDEVVVAVGYNPGKPAGMFAGPERAELVGESLTLLGLPNVRVTTFTGLVTEAAREEGADCLLKGIRSGTDLDAEMLQANMNHQTSGGLPTIFLPAIGPSALISSRYVREIAAQGGDVHSVVPPAVLNRLGQSEAAGSKPPKPQENRVGSPDAPNG
ncbi:MAG: pantetheine-phosphate adenylyltransferase [Acidimicrobiia bacterium]|nr:pantetheine-phosphate adenylyltransferase [Acidimicrobiia bacterium]